MDAKKAKNIWVIQTAFLGDCVLTLPFLYRLLEKCPQARVTLICAPAGEEIFRLALARGLAAFAARVKVHVLRKRDRHKGLLATWRFVRELLADGGKADMAFCVQRSARSGLLAVMSGAEERVGFSSGAVPFFYTQTARREWESGRAELEKNLDLLRIAGLEDLPPWDPATAPSLLANGQSARRDWVALSVGSPWPTKRWPVEQAIHLAKTLTEEGTEVHLLGDPSAVQDAAAIAQAVPSLLLHNHCGKTTVPEWVDKIATARILVSNDSAAVHVASDLGVPVVALFGPTLPEFGFAPWRKNSLALGVSHLNCRPCDIHGPKRCPLGHHRCLKDLSALEVMQAVKRIVQ